jgi:hypothetical protein
LVVALYCMTEVREITFRSPSFVRVMRRVSVIPSLKYSLSGSRLKLAKGRTAIERAGAAGFAGGVGSLLEAPARAGSGESTPASVSICTPYTFIGAARPLSSRSPRGSK